MIPIMARIGVGAMGMGTRTSLLGAVLMAGALLLPATAEADGWRGRGGGWHGAPYQHHYQHHHHRRGWHGGDAALGAIIGLGAGVVIGTVLAPPPPPRVIYAPPPPPVVVYHPPPVFHAPPKDHWVQPAPVWVPK